jgi:hypothetical protein
MYCVYCGSPNCLNNCQMTFVTGPIVTIPSITASITANIPNIPNINSPMINCSLNDFLEIIADKDDTEACIAFVDKQKKIQEDHIRLLEVMQQQHTANLEKYEKAFINYCKKYRPAITSELMIRIKNMKLFY